VLVLSQTLNATLAIAIVMVVTASVGTTIAGREPVPAVLD
jgi:threonine/homoserine efflux transporter RhtA